MFFISGWEWLLHVGSRVALSEALTIVCLEGPARVTAAAEAVLRMLPPSPTADDHAGAHDTFVTEARTALAPEP